MAERERDSNPRYDCSYTHFPSLRLKPSGRLNVDFIIKLFLRKSKSQAGGDQMTTKPRSLETFSKISVRMDSQRAHLLAFRLTPLS